MKHFSSLSEKIQSKTSMLVKNLNSIITACYSSSQLILSGILFCIIYNTLTKSLSKLENSLLSLRWGLDLLTCPGLASCCWVSISWNTHRPHALGPWLHVIRCFLKTLKFFLWYLRYSYVIYFIVLSFEISRYIWDVIMIFNEREQENLIYYKLYLFTIFPGQLVNTINLRDYYYNHIFTELNSVT